MRRTLSLFLSLALIVSILTGCTTKKKTDAPAPEAANGTTVTIHYFRYDGNYEPWDLWVWPSGKDGKGYKFDKKDDFGMLTTITYTEKHDKIGFIVRKGGDSWTAKDVDKDRYIEVQNGQAEIWVVEGEEQFETDRAKVSTAPKVRTAYMDSKRTIVASLSHPLELKGGTDGFTLKPALKIDNVKDARISEVGLIGYEFVDAGKQVRFVLEPGRLGLAKADQGDSAIYISGPFNGWSGTQNGSFKPSPEWKMTYSATAKRYELTVPVGSGQGQIPATGAEFKFTKDSGSGQEWYPSQNIALKQGTTTGDGTTEVMITLAEDADIKAEYSLEHTSLKGAAILKRGVLNDPAFVYTGDDLGHTYAPAGTKFRLWAPTVGGVSVLVYNGPEDSVSQAKAYPLKADQGGTWVGTVDGDLKGKYYTFQLETGNQKTEVMDPYAVGAGVNGNKALVVDWAETNPAGFTSHQRPAFSTKATDAILYEIHVRDISMNANSGIKNKGKFLAFTETGTIGPSGVKTGVDHLKELGVTHVHLLPAFDYASVDEKRNDQFNWGYDPKNFNVPEGSYATDPNGITRIKEFKQMVQGLHQNGLRVVMDVVYNHTSMGASPFDAIAPTYYYRYDATGKLSNGSGTGNETASERPMMRKYIVDSVKLWAKEYQVDGFRFDLMGLHDVETMKAVRAALDEIDPTIIIYGEPWTGGASALDSELRIGKGKQQGLNIAVFNDNIRNAIKGDNDGVTKGFATGAGSQTMNIQRGVVGGIAFDNWIEDFTKEPVESVNYASAHDNLTLWDKIAKSNASDSEADRIKMDLLAQAIVFTSQGVPFIHGGEEMLRTKGGNHNSYNAPDAVNQLDWSRKAQYSQVFDYYKGLIALRKAHPAFRLATADQIRRHLSFVEQGMPANTVVFRLKDHAGGDTWKEIIVIYNPNREDVTVSLPGGAWNVAAQGAKIGEAGSVTGSAKVPAISMMVLYQQ
ncbi:MAG TPA: type I pullulanase [Symbiobacteriaceae bacterium]|nr:type I pullulanase [Symbiobacteriaceae bacterium]